ncbi:ABC transporter ATP-binding protein [Metarhizobium album]|uniref:ABC transporter ATP-binding protein n=1 Tax=Metarhizobium album TaxID=2182425 RepID=A0A2U2DIF7_9HYPH|nr:ABC transporter ATP-binding protein [Rhizobium album]PWE53093.1 ABC transporter ATP-binding protein [Rhizobium album]
MPAVELINVSKTFGKKKALDNVSLAVEEGSFTVMCGPPKAGKSLIFRILVGLETADEGRILLSGRDITDEPASRRNIGYVPQSFALYPHMSVFDNIAYPLHLAGAPREEVARKVDATVAMLSITHLVKKTPDQLSGGEKQRVAVARGLMKDAAVFVLDDPLVGLDYKLRERLMDEMKQLCEELRTTFFYATSDSLEALTLAQSFIVLDDGRVVEKADVLSLYAEPQHVRSLELVGFPKANVLQATSAGGAVDLAGLKLAGPDGLAAGAVLAGIRPEDVRLDHSQALKTEGTVQIIEHLGSEIVVYLDVGGSPVTAAFAADGVVPPDLDSRIPVSVDPSRIMLFETASGRLLGRGRAGGAVHG